MINKNQINVNISACYFTETTVTNKNNYFTFLAVMLTLCELQLNGTGDPWWWKSQLEITKICSRCKSASLLGECACSSSCVHIQRNFVIRYPQIHTSSICNNALPDLALLKLIVTYFLDAGELLTGCSNGHTN